MEHDKCLKAVIDERSSKQDFCLMLFFTTKTESEYSLELVRFT